MGKTNHHLQRSRTFAFVLYPREDNLHLFLCDYYSSRESCVWIEHNRDIFTQSDFNNGKCSKEDIGTLKKPHTHFLVRFKNPRSVAQMQKDCTFNVEPESVLLTDFNNPANDFEKVRSIYFQPVTDYSSMIRYFIHDTVDCVYQQKAKYDITELHGDKDLIYQALNYLCPVSTDVYSCLLDIILTEHMAYHTFVQYICSHFPADSLEFQVFLKNKYDFNHICDSLMRWGNYNGCSNRKKKAVINDIKDEYEFY